MVTPPSYPARGLVISSRLPDTTTLRALLLTLLFLTMVGLRRTSDLRGYPGSALALLTQRRWAYGARHVERFLAHLAQADAADALTDALAQWTAQRGIAVVVMAVNVLKETADMLTQRVINTEGRGVCWASVEQSG